MRGAEPVRAKVEAPCAPTPVTAVLQGKNSDHRVAEAPAVQPARRHGQRRDYGTHAAKLAAHPIPPSGNLFIVRYSGAGRTGARPRRAALLPVLRMTTG